MISVMQIRMRNSFWIEILHKIFKDIMRYWMVCWPVALGLAGIVVVISLCTYLLRRRKISWSFLLWLSVVTVYFVCFVYITLFKREVGSFRLVELSPFVSFVLSDPEFYYVIENVILFIPLGMLVPIKCGALRRFYRMLILALMISAAIESLQYVFACGKTEVDDLITNVFGAWIGYGMYRMIWKRAPLGIRK